MFYKFPKNHLKTIKKTHNLFLIFHIIISIKQLSPNAQEKSLNRILGVEITFLESLKRKEIKEKITLLKM